MAGVTPPRKITIRSAGVFSPEIKTVEVKPTLRELQDALALPRTRSKFPAGALQSLVNPAQPLAAQPPQLALPGTCGSMEDQRELQTILRSKTVDS
eukprot:7606605-Karenia_brevis.AAC.1